jgi:uncharacterized protein (UPF0332 family)
MKFVLGKEYYSLADYFDSCRAKRNMADYTGAGNVSNAEVEELIKEVELFRDVTLDWLKHHPALTK